MAKGSSTPRRSGSNASTSSSSHSAAVQGATRDIKQVLLSLRNSYRANTSVKVQVIDSYAFFCVALAALMHVYMLAFGGFPFNAYLAALASCIGGATLSVCLRMQLDKTSPEPSDLAPERAYADFILAHVVLLFIAWNYVG